MTNVTDLEHAYHFRGSRGRGVYLLRYENASEPLASHVDLCNLLIVSIDRLDFEICIANLGIQSIQWRLTVAKL